MAVNEKAIKEFNEKVLNINLGRSFQDMTCKEYLDSIVQNGLTEKEAIMLHNIANNMFTNEEAAKALNFEVVQMDPKDTIEQFKQYVDNEVQKYGEMFLVVVHTIQAKQ